MSGIMKNISKKKKSNFKFIIILMSIVVSITLIRIFWVDWISVSGQSMLPTLQMGEFILVNKTKHATEELHYGDIVVVKHPNANKQLVKRVIGKAGDIIEIREGKLYINEKEQQEAYIYSEAFENMPAVLVEKESIFVMGDNRNYSSDSRILGSISKENIVGNAICVIFPFEEFRLLS